MKEIDKDLQKLREIYLVDVDEETRDDNLQRIGEWERDLLANEALLDWKTHDITKSIAAQAKDTYRGLADQLMLNRSLTEPQRASIYARQDAMLWLLTLTEANPKLEIKRIHDQIRAALAVR